MAEPFTCAIQCRIGDVNFAGHVDNVEALRVVDEARTRFFGLADPRTGERTPGVLDSLDAQVLPVVAAHRLEYHRELFASLTEPYVVRVWVAALGSSSLTIDTAISHPASTGGELPAVIAETTLVLHDLRTGRSHPIPEATRGALEAHRGDPLPLRPRPVP